jgi:hypothetical protein
VGYARGWRWIVEAFYLVRQQPLTWMLLAGGYLLIHFAVAAIPLLGPPLTFPGADLCRRLCAGGTAGRARPN